MKVVDSTRHLIGIARTCGGSLLVGCVVWLTGCAALGSREPGGAIDPTRVKTRDDIVAIRHFYQPLPWLTDNDQRVIGFSVPVYFVSGSTEAGAFVPGTIYVWVYELKTLPDGSTERAFVHGWEFDEEEAMGYRVARYFHLGFCYGFVLRWSNELDLSGKQIEIEFGYQRQDGPLITGPARRFRVPMPSGYAPTWRRNETRRVEPGQQDDEPGATTTRPAGAAPERPAPRGSR